LTIGQFLNCRRLENSVYTVDIHQLLLTRPFFLKELSGLDPGNFFNEAPERNETVES
jgi:hypothetical protein